MLPISLGPIVLTKVRARPFLMLAIVEDRLWYEYGLCCKST